MANTFNHNGKVVINDDGQMSINTTNFAYVDDKLYVDGNIIIPNNKSYLQGTTGGNRASIISLNSSNNLTVGQSNVNNANLFLYGGTGNVTINAGATEVARFTTSGNVGIGTTSPGAKLSIQNSGTTDSIISEYRMTNGSNAATFRTDDNVTFGIHSQNSGDIYIKDTSDNVLFYGKNGGNVGIGTTSPDQLLHINAGASTAYIRLVGQSRNLYVGQDGTGAVVYSDGNAPMAFFTSGTEKVRITSAGNVGIGTTAPQKVLEVISGANNFVSVGVDQINPGSWAGIHFGYRESNANYRKSAIVFERTDLTANDAQGKIHILNGPQGSSGSATLADAKLTIAENGNVGIGTTSPARKLDVAGTSIFRDFTTVVSSNGNPVSNTTWLSTDSGITNIYTGGNATVQLNSNGVSYFNGGNVGIGTTSPAYKLSVIGDSYVSSNLIVGGSIDATTYLQTIGIFYHRSDFYVLNKAANGWLTWVTRSTSEADTTIQLDYVRSINASNGGNVGIGTTSPTDKLAVVGNISIFSNNKIYNGSAADSAGISFPSNVVRIDGYSGITFNSSTTNIGSQTERMRITNSGNVGIGTTNPGAKLEVDSASTLPIIRARYNASYYTDYDSNGIQFVGTGQNFNITDNGSSVLYLKSGGNVGIGTTSPLGRLTVSGDGGLNTYAGVLRVVNTATTNAWGYISLPDDATTQSNPNNYYLIGRTSNILNRIMSFHIPIASDYGSGVQPKFGFYSTGGDLLHSVEASTGTSYFKGNVGIGTTSPGSKLQVNLAGDDRVVINQTAANNFGLQFAYNGTRTWDIYNSGASNSNLIFYSQVLGDNVATIASSGNVGIGTTSPSEKLHVDGNVIVTYNNSFQGINSIGNKAILARVSPTSGIINYAEYATAANLNGFVLGSDDARVKGDIATDSLDFITNTSSRMFINSSGNVGIGTTSPTARQSVLASASRPFDWGDTVARGALTFSGTSALVTSLTGDLQLFTDNGTTTGITVKTTSGNVGINTTSPSYKLDVVGDARITSGSLGVGVAPNATDGRIDASNDIVAYSTSDQRLKENVTPIENALGKVKTLTGVEFDWKEETAHVHGYHGHDVGIIAQDVQAVLPEAVRTNESGYLSVRYEKMIALLIEANKELAARVELLEQKLKQ